MLVKPAERVVTTPELVLIVATDGLDEVQKTPSDIFWVDPSSNAPRAINCWMVPTNRAGIFMMEDRVAEVTVRVVLPEILPKVAVMVTVLPAAAAPAVARPLLLLIVATDVFDELQVTWFVISWLVPSENVPMAENCWGAATGTLGLAGVTDMEDRVAEVTVRVVLPEILPKVAVMVTVLPAAAAPTVARPLLVTVTTAVLDEAQVSCVVISWLVPSEDLPMATNCCPNPAGTLGLAGVTDMEDRVTEVTVRGVLPEKVPEVAVMVTLPAEPAVARPLLVTVATDGLDEAQVTCVVISWFVPSEYTPKAVNC